MQARFDYLFWRYIGRKASSLEYKEFYNCVHSGGFDQRLQELMDDSAKVTGVNEVADDCFRPGAAERMLAQVFIESPVEMRISPNKVWLRIAIAIAASLLLFIGLYFYVQQQDIRLPDIAIVTDIAPGTTGATLTLADGRSIRLTEQEEGALAYEAGLTIRKTSDGQLIYELSAQQHPASGKEKLLNSLNTSRGEMYQVRLPDGTRVYLNASTQLTYSPNLVQEGKRVVELTGEAYFEVAKDKLHPFVVKSPGQEVEVLGTHFNIAAYADEPVFRTTLLEGQVRVHASGTIGNSDRVLRPGEQATLTEGAFIVNEVIATDAMSWTKGYFLFNDEPLESIMRKIARWYNVTVEYKPEAPLNMKFNGTVSRYAHVSQVLRKLELTNAVRFHIEKRKIIVER
ncbi:FecR family protein [Sphingobacterium sp. UBA6320]|jgi:transmembrane sensor|uniref:FecR family protein n=1 Tax=Sphingobacterium sp. UBA6320 TaxID=1947510 RepID=UPI0025E5412C|nr:FecR family protein [Sphingobacterium sp. UBA6320]